jgi:hypothetical protein
MKIIIELNVVSATGEAWMEICGNPKKRVKYPKILVGSQRGCGV